MAIAEKIKILPVACSRPGFTISWTKKITEMMLARLITAMSPIAMFRTHGCPPPARCRCHNRGIRIASSKAGTIHLGSMTN